MPGFLAPRTLTGNGKLYLAPARAPTVTPDPDPGDGTTPPGDIDATKVSARRIVAFPGNKRVVTFPGNKREVTF